MAAFQSEFYAVKTKLAKRNDWYIEVTELWRGAELARVYCIGHLDFIIVCVHVHVNESSSGAHIHCKPYALLLNIKAPVQCVPIS